MNDEDVRGLLDRRARMLVKDAEALRQTGADEIFEAAVLEAAAILYDAARDRPEMDNDI